MNDIDNKTYVGLSPSGQPIAGSALDQALRQRAADKREKEKEERKIVDAMSEDFPGLKRMYEIVKEREVED